MLFCAVRKVAFALGAFSPVLSQTPFLCRVVVGWDSVIFSFAFGLFFTSRHRFDFFFFFFFSFEKKG